MCTYTHTYLNVSIGYINVVNMIYYKNNKGSCTSQCIEVIFT